MRVTLTTYLSMVIVLEGGGCRRALAPRHLVALLVARDSLGGDTASLQIVTVLEILLKHDQQIVSVQ